MAAAKKEAPETMQQEDFEIIYLPIVSGEEPTVWVARNGRSWSIPRGQQVKVPKMVAEILRERDAREMAARAYAAEEAAKANQAVTENGTTIRF